MSKWKNQTSGLRKTKRERSQLRNRKNLGLLEKSVDYKKRAKDYKEKQKKKENIKGKSSIEKS